MKSYIIAAIVMLLVGGLLGLVLSVASNKFKVEEDARFEKIIGLFPGYNCGACGQSGCAGLANALINKETDLILCKPIKYDKKAEIIKYLAETPGPDGETITVR